MSASSAPALQAIALASAVRFTRPSKPPQSSIYCCKGSTPTGKPRSSTRKSITAFPSGEKLRLGVGEEDDLAAPKASQTCSGLDSEVSFSNPEFLLAANI